MGPNLAGTLTGLFIGIGLSAACGFRIFVPLLVVSIAARAGHVQLAAGWGWVSSMPAILAFATATALEIAAYYIPWLDNLLDTIATPAAVVAGIIITATCVGNVSPFLRWSLAIIAGGGAAATVQIGTTALRAASTATTGGAANPAVSTGEAGAAVGLSVLAVLLPILAAALTVLVVFMAVRFVYRRFRRRRAAAPDADLAG
jgi:hypothetical protein